MYIHVCTVVRKSLYVELVIQPTTQGLKPKDEKLTEEELENDIPENCARSLYEAYASPKSTHILTENLAENAVNN